MDDIHSINEAINKKAGRKLIPSILVSISILAVVFGTIIYVPILFGVFIWFAIMLAIREIVHAYKQGGIELPEFPLQLAGTALLVSAWYGRVSGLAAAHPGAQHRHAGRTSSGHAEARRAPRDLARFDLPGV